MVKTKGYQKRFYREWPKDSGLILQEVIVKETDLFISSETDVKDIAEKLVMKYRLQLEDYIKLRPEFLTSLKPIETDDKAMPIIKEMIKTTALAGVGPMASVAGAVAEFVGDELLGYSKQIIIENGGDIFMKTTKLHRIAIYAGDSPLSNKIFIKVKAEETPLGICTSSGTVGHSLSFGKADACVIISQSATLADAVATAACNRVQTEKDIEPALRFALSIKGIKGAIVILGKHIGSIGNIEIGG